MFDNLKNKNMSLMEPNWIWRRFNNLEVGEYALICIGSTYPTKDCLQLINNLPLYLKNTVHEELEMIKIANKPNNTPLRIVPISTTQLHRESWWYKKIWAWLIGLGEALLRNDDKIKLLSQWKIEYLNEEGVCRSVTSNAW